MAQWSKIRVLAVFNRVGAATIPIENFLHLDRESFALAILCTQQDRGELPDFVTDSPGLRVFCGGRSRAAQWASIVRALVEFRPDLIHGHHLPSAPMTFSAGRLLSRAKRVITLHNNFARYSGSEKRVFARQFRVADLVICNSASTLGSITTVLEGMDPPALTRVVYNGCDEERVLSVRDRPPGAPEIEAFLSDATLLVGSIGRLVDVKDHRTMLAAFSRLSARVPGVRFVLVGDGPLRAELQTLAGELGIGERTLFTGMLDRIDAYTVLSRLDVFVVSSLQEGFCNAMVEAMAAGVPVVASDIPVLREVLGSDGAFFRVSDPEDLAEKLAPLLCDRVRRLRYGDALRTRMAAHFSMGRCVRQHEGIYREMAGHGS